MNAPDRLVLGARWFTREEAMGHLARLPYRPISEPVVAYLSEAVEPGSHWTYDAPDAQPVITAAHR